jgi:cobalt-zinc-cadmium efflux system protein
MTRQLQASANDHNHDGHDHGHDPAHEHHSHAPTVTAGNERVVLVGFLLTFGFMIAEVIGGLLSGSLALIADAGHMLTDAIALALAWAGFRFGRRPSDRKRTFGYMRLEVLAGFVNAVSLFALVAWIAWEAVGRFLDPHPILAGPMLAVAVIGLVVNIIVFVVLRQGDSEHVNIQGAMLHVLGDLLGSVAAIIAAIAIYLTGWTPIDPILSVLLSLLILRSAWALLKNSLQILIEGAPAGIDVAGMPEALTDAVPGVAGVDHVHVWSITSGRPAATMEVKLTPGADPRETLNAVKTALNDRYGIGHSTIEIDFGDKNRDCSLVPDPAGERKGHTH